MPDTKVMYSGYDDKPTPYSVMKGLLLSDEDALSKNNVGRRWNFTHECDSNGYSSKITRINDMRDKYVKTFTYVCK